MFGFGVVLDVEEGDVQAHTADGKGEGEKYVGRLFEGGDIEKGASLGCGLT